jgi:uncharacterized protein (TIRG00374 family)
LGAFLDAVQVFWHHLSSVRWEPLAIALGLHVLKIGVRSLAWRNIVLAAYPDERLGRLPFFGAYAAGVGVNSIAPARVGDVVKLYLVKHRIDGSSYATLTPTLVVETLFDFVAAGLIFVWALSVGVLPTAEVIKRTPSVDWSWPLRHPNVSIVIAAVVVLTLLFVLMRTGRRVEEFRRKVGRGFAILSDFRAYLRLVVSWDVVSWLLRLGSVYYFLKAFGLTPSIHNALAVQVSESLSTLMPFTPGGAGTKQGLTAYALKGEPVSAAIAFSVGMNIALVAVNVVLGFAALFLMARTFRFRRIADRQKQESGEAPAA